MLRRSLLFFAPAAKTYEKKQHANTEKPANRPTVRGLKLSALTSVSFASFVVNAPAATVWSARFSVGEVYESDCYFLGWSSTI